jgi:hypothetical protein
MLYKRVGSNLQLWSTNCSAEISIAKRHSIWRWTQGVAQATRNYGGVRTPTLTLYKSDRFIGNARNNIKA